MKSKRGGFGIEFIEQNIQYGRLARWDGFGKSRIYCGNFKSKKQYEQRYVLWYSEGAIEALKLGKEWFEAQNEIYSRRRNLIFGLVDKLGCSYDKNSVGMFVWAKLSSDVASAEDFIDRILLEKHIFSTLRTIFGSNGEGYIRFSLCVKEEKIREAIEHSSIHPNRFLKPVRCS